jgi:hypothetical protein
MNNLTSLTLLAQFEQWAAADYEFCRIFHLSAGIINIEVGLDGRWEPIWSAHLSGLTASSKAILQAVVQEAIAAKNWDCQLSRSYDYSTPIPTRIWEAKVSNPFEVDATGSAVVHLINHAESAIALFSAYLQALAVFEAAA